MRRVEKQCQAAVVRERSVKDYVVAESATLKMNVDGDRRAAERLVGEIVSARDEAARNVRRNEEEWESFVIMRKQREHYLENVVFSEEQLAAEAQKVTRQAANNIAYLEQGAQVLKEQNQASETTCEMLRHWVNTHGKNLQEKNSMLEAEVSALKASATSGDYNSGVEWGAKRSETRFAEKISQLQFENKELVTHVAHAAAVADSRLKEEIRQNNEMARLRQTDETYYESRLQEARVTAGYPQSEQAQEGQRNAELRYELQEWQDRACAIEHEHAGQSAARHDRGSTSPAS